MKEVFGLKKTFLYLIPYFVHRNVKTTHYSIQSIKCLAPKIWGIVPDQEKHYRSLTKFKSFIKSWSPSDCPFWLCKAYIAQVGFI